MTQGVANAENMVDKNCVRVARRGLTSMVDGYLDKMQDVEGSLRWSQTLGGGLCPVNPSQNQQLTLKSGKMPEGLSGVYMRIGPNVQYWPPKKRTHVFDGDGMVHCVRFDHGAAVYHCDYLQTPRFRFEKEYGTEWFPRIGEFHGKAGLAKILALNKKKNALSGLQESETGVANTAIGYTPEGKLWALNEGGAPFHFRLTETGAPESIGFDDLQGTFHENMSAHPKFDQKTGETFFHGRRLMEKFYMGHIKDGKLVARAPLKMPDGFHHDMFITENFVVIVDGSSRFEPKGVVKKRPLWTMNREASLRFGIFDRRKGEMTSEGFQWIEAGVSAEIVHTLYAHDEGDEIVLWAPVSYYKEDEVSQSGKVLGDIGLAKMHRLVIDTKTDTVTMAIVEGGERYNTEFPRIRDDMIGLRTRYGYSGIQDEGASEFNFRGFLKWDFEECKLVGAIHLPDRLIGGEPVFIPAGEEDNGYLGLILWNEETHESTFNLYDAKTFEETPVVELAIPCRVPLGFHAAWITEEQFQKQLNVAVKEHDARASEAGAPASEAAEQVPEAARGS